MRTILLGVLAVGVGLISSCALRPSGESEERDRASQAGSPYEGKPELPTITEKSGPEDYLAYAFLSNAALEARYWEWRAALERIPQDSSFPNVAVSFGYMFSPGSMKSWDRTTLGISNDPMTNIPFPTKLATAGRAALENARAAGERFREAKFLLQKDVLWTYDELALVAETIRIQTETLSLLRQAVSQSEVRVRTGTAGQQDLLKAQTEVDLGENDLKSLESRAKGVSGKLNALLGRPAETPVPLPTTLPALRPVPVADADLLRAGAERSPELAALARDIGGREEVLSLAQQAYIPDFGLSASLTGSLSRSIGAMAILPLRLEAIHGEIEEARANLRATEAARVQYRRDLAASFVLNLTVLRNDERQVELLEKVILPRARQTVELSQTSYAAGKLGFLELLDAQRTLLEVRLTLAQVKIEREKAVSAIETWSTVDVEVMEGTRMPLRAVRMSAGRATPGSSAAGGSSGSSSMDSMK
jgi:outer membrane protein TolC